MRKPLRFVDAHVHLWDLGHIDYPWLQPPFDDGGVMGSVEPIAHTYLLDDYLADADGWNVTGLVHVDAGADPRAARAETEWLQSIADARGMPNAIVAFAPLDDPQVEALLASHAAARNVRGIRHIANWHPNPALSYTPRNLLEDVRWQQGFALLSRYDLSFDLQIYPGQMEAAAHLAQRHPDIPVILNHAGMPLDPRDDAGFAAWCDGMAALADVPSVSTKISGFGIVAHDWTRESIARYVLTAIDLFGVDRVMFASDFPTDKLYARFGDLLGAYASITSDFDDDERDAMFARNAERIYRFESEQ